MSDQETYTLGGFVEPLIGIPQYATLEECDCCHEIIPLREAVFNGIQTLCKECADKITA